MISYEEYSKIRAIKGLKDGKVASLAGIGRSTFSDWKSGRSVPKEDKLKKIAEALGVTYAYLMGWENTSDPSTAALEHIINVNNENGGSSEMAQLLYNQTVKPAAIELTHDEIILIEKYRNADDTTKDMIVRLLAYASLVEKDDNNAH